MRLHLLIRYAMVIPTTTMPSAAETVMETSGSAPFIQWGNPAADSFGGKEDGIAEKVEQEGGERRMKYSLFISFDVEC